MFNSRRNCGENAYLSVLKWKDFERFLSTFNVTFKLYSSNEKTNKFDKGTNIKSNKASKPWLHSKHIFYGVTF